MIKWKRNVAVLCLVSTYLPKRSIIIISLLRINLNKNYYLVPMLTKLGCNLISF